MNILNSFFVILVSVAVLLFIGDKTIEKYDLNPLEATCTNEDVEGLLITLATGDLSSELKDLGFILQVAVEKGSTFTEKKEISYRGRLRYECETSLSLKITPVEGNAPAAQIFENIPEEDRIVKHDIKYFSMTNDIGGSIYIKTIPILTGAFFVDDITAAAAEIELAKPRQETSAETENPAEEVTEETTEAATEAVSNDVQSETPTQDKDITEMSSAVKIDTDLAELKLNGENESCKIIIDVLAIQETDCVKLTNSSGINIVCTPNKTICKTVTEVGKSFGLSW